ncbi:hypothetical protein WT97_03700 [Burkholderia sp. MSMB1459WGS]|nr:hypothetical protein WT97_03700 [Burkholderia sp. MSMB1459WGS]
MPQPAANESGDVARRATRVVHEWAGPAAPLARALPAAEPFAALERETRAAIARMQHVPDRVRAPRICNVLYLRRPSIQCDTTPARGFAIKQA